MGDVTPTQTRTCRFVWAYIRTNPFEFGLGVAAAITATAQLVSRDVFAVGNAVAQQSQGLAYMWLAVYLIGGLGVVGGMLGSSTGWGWRVELAGLFLLIGGLAGNTAAVVAIRGLLGLVYTATLLCFTFSAAVRASAIMQIMRTQGRRR